MEVGGQLHVPAALPPGMTRYPLYRRLGWPQGSSGRVRNFKCYLVPTVLTTIYCDADKDIYGIPGAEWVPLNYVSFKHSRFVSRHNAVM
jgi:hypothetical protein